MIAIVPVKVVVLMRFFNLSLRQRLLLAAIPTVLLLLPVTSEYVTKYGYATLFGALVMAPFLTPGPWLFARFALLVATPIVTTFTLFAAIDGENFVPQFLLIRPLIDFDITGQVYGIGGLVFDMLEMALLLAVLPAFVLFIVAPLTVSWRYWTYTLSSGVLTAASVVIWVQWFWCIVGCSWWDNVSLVFPYALWSISFCVAVYFGRVNRRRGHFASC